MTTTWVLIIFISRFGGLYNSSPATAVATVQGYQTHEECIEALKFLKDWEAQLLARCIPGPARAQQ